MKRMLWILVALMSVALVGAVFAQSASEDFKAKWKRLTKDPDKVFKVTAKPGEEIPEATLDLSFGPGSLVSVSRGKRAKRDMLEEHDIVASLASCPEKGRVLIVGPLRVDAQDDALVPLLPSVLADALGKAAVPHFRGRKICKGLGHRFDDFINVLIGNRRFLGKTGHRAGPDADSAGLQIFA